VEAKREDTDAFDVRYGSVEIEDAMESASAVLVLGSLKEGVLAASRDSRGEALLVVMEANKSAVGYV
jgi:hypothetical protein